MSTRTAAATTFFASCVVVGATLLHRSLQEPSVPQQIDDLKLPELPAQPQSTRTPAVDNPRLFVDQEPVSFDSPMGTVRLCVAGGYYGISQSGLPQDHPAYVRKASTAIFLTIEGLTEFPTELARAFRIATDGYFQMERPRGSGMGDPNGITAVISAGINGTAHTRYNELVAEGKDVPQDQQYRGYFTTSVAPQLQPTARLMAFLLGVENFDAAVNQETATPTA